jgi:hypothetical protein
MGSILLLVLAYIIIVSYYEFVKHVLQYESCLFQYKMLFFFFFFQCLVWLKNYGPNLSLKRKLA